ncbi:hypothetical protein BpHYR1_037694, partial [Brachionus plicatilis]
MKLRNQETIIESCINNEKELNVLIQSLKEESATNKIKFENLIRERDSNFLDYEKERKEFKELIETLENDTKLLKKKQCQFPGCDSSFNCRNSLSKKHYSLESCPNWKSFEEIKRQTEIDLKNALYMNEKLKIDQKEKFIKREKLLTQKFSEEKEKLENEIVSKNNQLIEKYQEISDLKATNDENCEKNQNHENKEIEKVIIRKKRSKRIGKENSGLRLRKIRNRENEKETLARSESDLISQLEESKSEYGKLSAEYNLLNQRILQLENEKKNHQEELKSSNKFEEKVRHLNLKIKELESD